MKSLEALRKEIDILDAEIAERLTRRFAVVSEIGEYKKLNGLPVVNAAREDAVIAKIRAFGVTPAEQDALEAVYRTVILQARTLEK